MITAKKLITVLVLAVLIFILHFALIWKDSHYPLDDAGAYAQVAQEVYLMMKTSGLAKGLSFAYFHRDWKPILGQDLLVPFYFLSGGDTRLAVRIYLLVFGLLFVLVLFAALEKCLNDPWAALLGCCLIGFTPWMVFDLFTFGAELPWLLFSLLAYVFFKTRPALSTASLALSLMCRPLESAVVILPPYLYALFQQWRAGRKASSIAGQLMGVFLPVGLWFLPFVSTLGHWIEQTSTGSMVAANRALRPQSENFFVLFFKSSGIFIFLPLVAAAAHIKVFQAWIKTHSKWAACALWSGFALALAGSLTLSLGFRYYHLSWIVVSVFGLHALVSVVSKKRAYAVIAALVALQAYGSLPGFFARDPWDRARWPFFYEVSVRAGRAPAYREFGSDLQFEYLADQLLVLDVAADARFTFIDLQNTRGPLPLTNPWKYQLRTREKGRRWSFAQFDSVKGEAKDAPALVAHALRTADILVVGPPARENSGRSQENAVAEALFYCDESCGKFGVDRIGRISMAATQEQKAFEFQVFARDERRP